MTTTERRASLARCPVHDGQIHGFEAEELRRGLEALLRTGEVSAGTVRELLDRVDARDSLGHLERVEKNRRRKTGRS